MSSRTPENGSATNGSLPEGDTLQPKLHLTKEFLERAKDFQLSKFPLLYLKTWLSEILDTLTQKRS